MSADPWEDLLQQDAPDPWETLLSGSQPQVGDELGLLPAVAADEARFKPWSQPGDAGSPLETSGSNSAGSAVWSGDALDSLADMGARASNGMYMGYGDELVGRAYDFVGGDGNAARDNVRNRMQLAKERSPGWSMAGDIAGGAVPALATGGMAAGATRALPLAGRIAAGGGLGAEQAALSASGYADDGDRGQAALDALPLGFALGGAGEVAATGIQGAGNVLRNNVAPWLRDQGLLNRVASTGRPAAQLSKELGGRQGMLEAGQWMEDRGMTQWSPQKLGSNIDDYTSMRQGDQRSFLDELAENPDAYPVNVGKVADDLAASGANKARMAADNAQTQAAQYRKASERLASPPDPRVYVSTNQLNADELSSGFLSGVEGASATPSIGDKFQRTYMVEAPMQGRPVDYDNIDMNDVSLWDRGIGPEHASEQEHLLDLGLQTPQKGTRVFYDPAKGGQPVSGFQSFPINRDRGVFLPDGRPASRVAASEAVRVANRGAPFEDAWLQRQEFDQGARWNAGDGGDKGLAAVNRDAANGLRNEMGTALDNTSPELRPRWESIQGDLSTGIGLSGGADAATVRELGGAPAPLKFSPMAAAAGTGPMGYGAALLAQSGGRGAFADAFGGASSALDSLASSVPGGDIARGAAQTGAQQSRNVDTQDAGNANYASMFGGGNSMQSINEKSRGYLLPQAAQQMMQERGALGPYEAKFFEAAGSEDSHALSALIVRLSHTDQRFRQEYLPKLQALTADGSGY